MIKIQSRVVLGKELLETSNNTKHVISIEHEKAVRELVVSMIKKGIIEIDMMPPIKPECVHTLTCYAMKKEQVYKLHNLLGKMAQTAETTKDQTLAVFVSELIDLLIPDGTWDNIKKHFQKVMKKNKNV